MPYCSEGHAVQYFETGSKKASLPERRPVSSCVAVCCLPNYKSITLTMLARCGVVSTALSNFVLVCLVSSVIKAALGRAHAQTRAACVECIALREASDCDQCYRMFAFRGAMQDDTLILFGVSGSSTHFGFFYFGPTSAKVNVTRWSHLQ